MFHYNRFWVDVFNSWQIFTQVHKPSTHSDVLITMIWYNNQIKVGDKCVYYKYWLSAGIYFIGDLLDNNVCFLSLNNFRAKFKVRTNLIEYGAILRAIGCFQKYFVAE